MEINKNAHPGYAMEYWKLVAMFAGDPDFHIGTINDETKSCTIKIKSKAKAELFKQLCKVKYLKINVSVSEDIGKEDELAELFSTNPHFSQLYSPNDNTTFMKAVLFKPECLRYFSDESSSPTRHTAILPRDLVQDLFGDDINIQTDLSDVYGDMYF